MRSVEEIKQDIANHYAELGLIMEQLAVLEAQEHAKKMYRNEILEKIMNFRKELNGQENPSQSNEAAE